MAAVDTPRRRHPSVPPPTAISGPVPGDGARRLASRRKRSSPRRPSTAGSAAGAVARAGGLLVTSDGRRFLLRDAVRVLGRRNGDTDPYGFTGRVEAIRDLIRRGANVSADALRLGPAVYDIEYGFVAIAAGGPA